MNILLHELFCRVEGPVNFTATNVHVCEPLRGCACLEHLQSSESLN